MLDDRIPGIAEKRAEIEGWPAMARAEGWYEPDDEVDAHLPYLTRDLAWEDRTWRANEHSFSLLLERYVRPGMRVLEVGAAKAWAAQHLVPLGVDYGATALRADPPIALAAGADDATEAALAAVADRVIRYPYAEPVDRPLAWIHSECRGDWVLTIDDDEIPSRGLLDALASLAAATDVTHHWLPRRWLYA